MYCPITGAECRQQNCAWFEQSRRRYQDHVEGKCIVWNMVSELRGIEISIGQLETTLRNKDFSS